MNNRSKAYFQLHLAVLLFGFTAILGRLIQLPEAGIVWYRLIITCLSLLVFRKVWKAFFRTPRKRILRLVGIGIIVCLHWVAFYGSVKYSNVSVALSCMATASFMTAIMEPLMSRTKFKPTEVFLGLLVIPGIYLIFHFAEFYLVGIIMGLTAAFLAAIFSILNKRMIAVQDAQSITFFELGGGWIFLTLLLPFYYHFFPDAAFIPPNTTDWIYLLLLGILCTTVAYVISVQALKELSAFTSNLTINLEPVYGIILAFFIFKENENLNPGFFAGTLLILLAVFLQPLAERLAKRRRNRQK